MAVELQQQSGEEENFALALLEKDETLIDFTTADFDAKKYANAVIEGQQISEALARLSSGVDILNKQLQEQVANNHGDLLAQATGIETLEGVLQSIQARIQSLCKSMDRIKNQVNEPYKRISSRTVQLHHLQSACDLLRRTIRVLYLSKRLQVQLKAGTRELAKAAQSLNELGYVVEGANLTGIKIIEDDLQRAQRAKTVVIQQAEQMLTNALDNQNLTQVGTALQVFHNLDCLRDQVNQNLAKHIYSIQEHLSMALTVENQNGQGPGSQTAWRASLWTNLDKLMNQMHMTMEKVCLLEKVLGKKRDPSTHICFINQFSKDGVCLFVNDLWETAVNILKNEFQKATEGSAFLKQALEGEYPKLLRMFNDLWERLHQHHVSLNSNSTSITGKPDILIGLIIDHIVEGKTPLQLLKSAIHPFETAYLSKSLSRLFDPINLVFPSAATHTPTNDDVNSIVKAMASEMSVANVDNDLLLLVCNNIAKTIRMYVAKCEQLVSSGSGASQLSGGLTNAQTQNASIVNSLCYLHEGAAKILSTLTDPPIDAVRAIETACQDLLDVVSTTLDFLLIAVQQSLDNKVMRIHTENFAVSLPVLADNDHSGPPCSPYINVIKNFISHMETDYFSLYECKSVLLKRLVPIAGRLFEMFIRHSCLLRDISEAGRLRLATDIAQLEFAVAPLCAKLTDVGNSYKMIRAFRSLLFMDLNDIPGNHAIVSLPRSLVLHFLFTQAPPDFRSPHTIAGWTISEYSEWLDGQFNEDEQLRLIRDAVESYKKALCERGQKNEPDVVEIMTKILDIN